MTHCQHAAPLGLEGLHATCTMRAHNTKLHFPTLPHTCAACSLNPKAVGATMSTSLEDWLMPDEAPMAAVLPAAAATSGTRATRARCLGRGENGAGEERGSK